MTEPFIFLFIFLSSFFFHEAMHYFEAWRQDAEDIYIIIDFRHLSMKMFYEGYVEKYELVSLAGGVYTAPIMFLMVFCSEGFWQWSFLTMGYVQLAYGIFECLASFNIVKLKYRYIIYITIIGVMMTIWIMMKYVM